MVSDHNVRWLIFVISLRDAEKRRAEIACQLHGLGLSFEIVDATDGRQGLTLEQEQLIDRPGTLARIEREMTDAEYACALSHLGVWQRILDRDLSGAVILEDDARLDRPFADFLNAQGYDAAPLVLLDHEKALAWNWSRPVRTSQGVQLWRIVGNADRIHAHATPARARADWPCDISRLHTLAAEPQIARHPVDQASQSLLENDRRVARAEKLRNKRASRYFTAAHWVRVLRKRLDPQRARKLLGQRIA